MILETIRRLYPELTTSQRRLAEHLTHHYRAVAFMTAEQVAQELGVNEATVIRFAQRLGYEGFPRMMADLRVLMRDELAAGDALVGGQLVAPSTAQADDGSTIAPPLGQLLALERALSHVDAQALERAGASLVQAGRVLCLGQGSAVGLARALADGLATLGLPAEAPSTDVAALALTLGGLGLDDAVVGLALASEGEEVANALRHAAALGCRTLALSGMATAPCALVADEALVAAVEGPPGVQPLCGVAFLAEGLLRAAAAARSSAQRSRAAAVEAARAALQPGRRR